MYSQYNNNVTQKENLNLNTCKWLRGSTAILKNAVEGPMLYKVQEVLALPQFKIHYKATKSR
jgi:hypothetical protein